jgi:hypothetical protein
VQPIRDVRWFQWFFVSFGMLVIFELPRLLVHGSSELIKPVVRRCIPGLALVDGVLLPVFACLVQRNGGQREPFDWLCLSFRILFFRCR